MRKLLLIALVLLFVQFKSNAQKIISTKAQISNVKFLKLDEKVNIRFDIVKAKKDNLFNIKVKAFNDFGDEITITSVSGDLDSISPGLNKKIVWHIHKDLFQIDENIYIEVTAELLTPTILQPIKKGKAFLFSTLFPGIGTYRLSSKKYHLTKGVISYSLITASIYNSVNANNYYDDYLESLDPNERNTLYNKSLDKQRIAKAYAISAVSVWLIEYVNIYFADNKVLNNNLELSFNVDQFSNTPLFSLNFKF